MRTVISEFISLDGVVQAPGGVHELNLMIEPIVLGGGKTIFSSNGAARRFELVESKTASTGVLVCRYQRAR